MFFEPTPPVDIDENTDSVFPQGDVGFCITLDTILPVRTLAKACIRQLQGDLWEGPGASDLNKELGVDVEVRHPPGSCMTQPPCRFAQPRKDGRRQIAEATYPLTHGAGWQEMPPHKKEADALAEENLGAAKIYAELTGATVAEMLELMNEERVMRADEMLQRGFVNEIKKPKKRRNGFKRSLKKTESARRKHYE